MYFISFLLYFRNFLLNVYHDDICLVGVKTISPFFVLKSLRTLGSRCYHCFLVYALACVHCHGIEDLTLSVKNFNVSALSESSCNEMTLLPHHLLS